MQPLRVRQRSLTLQLLLPRAERLYRDATRLADTSTATLPVRDRDGGREGGWGERNRERQRQKEKEREKERSRQREMEKVRGN